MKFNFLTEFILANNIAALLINLRLQQDSSNPCLRDQLNLFDTGLNELLVAKRGRAEQKADGDHKGV
jgi:hypothetical protein